MSPLGHEREDLVVPEPQHVVDPRPAVPGGALDVTGIGDLATTGGVERRLDELGEDASVVLAQSPHGRLPGRRLIADEIGREAGLPRERLGELAQLLAAAGPARTRASAHTLILHQRLEAGLVDTEVVLGDELEREVDRETVRVVQKEGVAACDALGAGVPGSGDELVEQAAALGKGAPEALLLGFEPFVHRRAACSTSSGYSPAISSVTMSA